MAYYHCNETDEILTTDQIRSMWEQMKADGSIDPDDPFDYFLSGCMTWNNGSLEPLSHYINRLRLQLWQAERLDNLCHGEYTDEIDNLTTQIAEYEKYERS